jgi:hypothetical protein
VTYKKGDNSAQKKPRKSSNPPPAFVLGGINKQGRPTAYQPEFDEVVHRLRLLMLTKEEIAQFFGVSTTGLDTWARNNPSFNSAYAEGGEICDGQIAFSLADRAKGVWIEEEQAVKVRVDQFRDEIQIVKVKKFIPPDYNCAALWLSNRHRGRWKTKADAEEPNTNVTINVTGGLPDE